jgi:protein-L-isoaspartate O-methyltransferase
MSKGERFINPKDVGSHGKYWKETAGPRKEFSRSKLKKRLGTSIDVRLQEVANNMELDERQFYKASRIEDPALEEDSISHLHGESFIEGFLASKVRNLKGQEKVKVLDLGGGSGAYAEQIRQKFGNSVRVYTTGIRKEMAKLIRNQPEIFGRKVSTEAESLIKNKKLKKDDLKWRSIRQLSDYQEFDLILSTYGEMFYEEGSDHDKSVPDLLEMAIKKLKVGGLISISPVSDEPYYQKVFEQLKRQFQGKYRLTLEFVEDSVGDLCFKIHKEPLNP